MSPYACKWLIAGAFGFLLPGLVLAAPAAESKPKPESAAEKVRKALDQPVEIELTNQSLAQAVEVLRELTKINFIIDSMVLAQMGVDANSIMVSCKKQAMKGKAALRTILHPNNLSYAIIGDTVVITTEDMALHKQLKQKVTVDLDKAPFATALTDLCKECAVNLLIDKKVAASAKAEVSLQFEDVSLDAVVRLLCEQAGLKPVRLGNVIYITSVASAKELRAEPDLAPNIGTMPAYGIDAGVNPPPGVLVPGDIGIALPAPAVPGGAVAPPAKDEEKKTADPKPDEKKDDKKPDKSSGD